MSGSSCFLRTISWRSMVSVHIFQLLFMRQGELFSSSFLVLDFKHRVSLDPPSCVEHVRCLLQEDLTSWPSLPIIRRESNTQPCSHWCFSFFVSNPWRCLFSNPRPDESFCLSFLYFIHQYYCLQPRSYQSMCNLKVYVISLIFHSEIFNISMYRYIND